MAELTSVSNPRVKDIVKLRNRRLHHDPGRFLIDEERLVIRALQAGIEVDDIYRLDGSKLGEGTVVSREVMVKMSGRQNPPMALAVAMSWDLAEPEPTADESWLALVEIEKPGNVGAVLRTAAALGFTGVVLVDSAVDPFLPNVVRNSMGALFTVQVAAIDQSRLPDFVKARSARLVAAVSSGGAAPWDQDLGSPIVIAIGSESSGLSDSLIEAADDQVTIPMADDSLDSLNASVSAAILMSESVRQRS